MTTEEETMASHKELRELMLICLYATTITTTTLFHYSHVSTWYYSPTILNNFQYIRFIYTIL